MRHVASGETQRQCSTKESAHTAPAKHQAYELPMNSKLVARKGGIGAYCSRCCDASRVDRDDAHAFTNYASPSLAEIGALAEQRGRSAAEPIYPSIQTADHCLVRFCSCTQVHLVVFFVFLTPYRKFEDDVAEFVRDLWL